MRIIVSIIPLRKFQDTLAMLSAESKFNLDALSIHFLFHLLYCKVTFLFSLRCREISYVNRGNIIYENINRPTLEDLDLMPTTNRLCLSTFVSFKIRKVPRPSD